MAQVYAEFAFQDMTPATAVEYWHAEYTPWLQALGLALTEESGFHLIYSRKARSGAAILGLGWLGAFMKVEEEIRFDFAAKGDGVLVVADGHSSREIASTIQDRAASEDLP